MLFDESGAPVEGATGVTVRVYDAEAALQPLWEPAVPLDVLCETGVFNALVPAAAEGADAEAFAAAFAEGEPRWLGIAPAGGAEPSPRIPVVSVAYALVAGKAAVAEVAELARGLDCAGCVPAGALDPAVQAAFLAYNGSGSGLTATTYQAAVDESAGLFATLAGTLASLEGDVGALAAVARSGSYADLVDTPDVCAAALACPHLAELAADLWCFKNCGPLRLGDCRARTCDGAAETCTDAGALPDGSPCAGGGECVSGQCASGLRCGGVLCPTLSGDGDDEYIVGCNMREHCEYANRTVTGWKRWDVWIWVPPGKFVMGSPSDEVGRRADEEPQHVVRFATGFFIAKYEVTVMQYEACRVVGSCTMAPVADWDGLGWGLNSGAGRDSHPQNGVNWERAGQVCA